jgi:outer membrane receptor for Fe3+-dicitrate
MKPRYNAINDQLKKISDQLVKRIEELAVKVVKDNDGIADFCMGMGSASFGVDFLEINEDGEEWRVHDDYDLDDGILKWQWKHEAAIKEIFYILDEYNWQFKLTGSARLIKKVNGEITIAYHW